MGNVFTYGGADRNAALCAALGLGCLFLGAVCWLGRRGKIRVLWGVLAALLTAGTLTLCVLAPSLGMLIARPAGDPAAVITEFLDALTARDWPAAYEKMDAYSQLGLENAPEDPAAAALAEALGESYAYTLTGECAVEGLVARQSVRFTRLSLSQAERAAEERLPSVLADIVDSRPRSQVYDSDDNYFPQVAREAYLTALTEILHDPAAYLVTEDLTLTARFAGGEWAVVPDQALLLALSGGAA